MATVDKGLQNALQGNASLLRTCFPVLELDPAFVKAIQHLHERPGVRRALVSEETLPGFAPNGVHAYRTTKELRESAGDLVRRHPLRAFQFNNAATAPFFLKQPGGHPANVRSCHHRQRLVER